MDPLSISVGVASLVKICAQAISSCREIASSFQDAPRIILTLQSECSTTRESLALIYKLINKSDTTALSNLSISDSLAESFDIALTGCTVTLSVLDNEMQDILNQQEREDTPGFRQKAKYAWNENTLTKAMEELRGQREALTLLVTVLQSHSLTEILDRLREKANVFKTIRQNTNTMRRSVEHPEGTSDDDLNTLDTYSIFSEAAEERPDFEDQILRSRAYRRVYDSINKASRRPRYRRHLHAEPPFDLLEEDLIGLHEYPALKPTYSEELHREMLPSDKVQNTHENPPSHSPSCTNHASKETVEPEGADLEVSTAVQPAHSSNVVQQPPPERSPALRGTSESSDQHWVSSQGQVLEDAGFTDDMEQGFHNNSSPKSPSFDQAEGAENPESRRSSKVSTSASATEVLKVPTKWIPTSIQEDRHTPPTPDNEDVERASLVKDDLKSSEKSPLPTLSDNPSTNPTRKQNKNSIPRLISTSQAQVEIEVEERQRQDTLRASAVAMARKMFAIQQAQIDDAKRIRQSESSDAEHAARRRSQSDNADDVTVEQGRYVNLEEAARRLAVARLAKLHEEHTEFRQYYRQQESPRRSLRTLRSGRPTGNLLEDSDSDAEMSDRIRTSMTIFQSRLSEIDSEKRRADRDALLAIARKNVTARMKGMDDNACSESGKTHIQQQRESWERQARERAQQAEEDRIAHAGKVHIGGGKWIEQSQIEAIARARLQPTLDEIAAKAEQQRARDEDVRLEQERIRAQAAADKKRRAELRAERGAGGGNFRTSLRDLIMSKKDNVGKSKQVKYPLGERERDPRATKVKTDDHRFG